jgi:hypothetical protein
MRDDLILSVLLMFDYSNESNARTNRDCDRRQSGTAPKQTRKGDFHDVYF